MDVKNEAGKFESYYRKLIEFSKENVEGPKVIGLSLFKEQDIYTVITDAQEIFDKYKNGDIDYNLAHQDILKLCSLGFQIAQYAGMLKGGARHNSNIRKIQIAQHAVSIREKYAFDKSEGQASKLTDKAISELAEISCEQTTEDLMKYESLAEIFYASYSLIVHFTTILNSMLKRENENQRNFGSHAT